MVYLACQHAIKIVVMWYNRVHVHWTKLESASIQLKREDKVIWALS